jgi:hypothetical protein
MTDSDKATNHHDGASCGEFTPRRLDRRNQFFQPLGELHIFAVVHRAVDDRHGVVGEGLLEQWREIGGALDALAFGAEALGVFDEIGIFEQVVH